MGFLVKHLYLLAPILAVLLLFGAYKLVKDNDRPVPKYEPKVVEDTWSAEEYLKHLNNRPFNQDELHRLLLRRTRQKPGVYLESLLPVMDSAGVEIVFCFHQVVGDDYVPVITSGNDYPYHARYSKHYMNAAIDFRIKDIPFQQRKKVVELAQQRLQNRFKVIWEKGEAEHLHVELLEP